MEQSDQGQIGAIITTRTRTGKRAAFEPKKGPEWLELCNKMDDSNHSDSQIRRFAEDVGIPTMGRNRSDICKDLAMFHGEKLKSDESEISIFELKPPNIDEAEVAEVISLKDIPEEPPSESKKLGDLLKRDDVGYTDDYWDKSHQQPQFGGGRGGGYEYTRDYDYDREYGHGMHDMGYKSCDEDYTKGYYDGFPTGELEGFNAGAASREGEYELGFNDGRSTCDNDYELGMERGGGEGYNQGVEEGKDEGFAIGYNRGFDEGKLDLEMELSVEHNEDILEVNPGVFIEEIITNIENTMNDHDMEIDKHISLQILTFSIEIKEVSSVDYF